METRNHSEVQPTYEQFEELPEWERMRVVADSRIVNTDAYNRTMDYLRGPEGWRQEETYTLQMRRSPYDYLIVAGIEDAVAELTSKPITQQELDFATTFYEENNIPFFNKDMWQAVIDENDGFLPITVHGAPDGTVVLPTEPLLRVTGPGELIAHFEHIFHRPFYPTLVATKAHEITKLLGDPSRFIEVGKRGTPDELTHLMAIKAMRIGGDINLTSNDAGAAVFGDITPIGTIGHRYVQRYPSVEQAFRHAVENLDSVTLLVDLIDSYDGMDLTLKLKEECRQTGKKIYARLDSGNLTEQLHYYLWECEQRGFIDPALDRIVVEGIESLEEMADIENSLTEAQKARVTFGAGSLLTSQKTSRSDASTGFKLAEYETPEGEFVPTQKYSDSPGKENIPGQPTIAIINGQRVVAQANEVRTDQDLLPLLYAHGQHRPQSNLATAQARREQQLPLVQSYIEQHKKAAISPATARMIGEVASRYGLEK